MEFRINYDAPLADGLVFAGLGGYGCVGSMVYPDSSLYGNHGKLTNMDAATDWVYVPELGRWGNDFDGTNDFVSVASHSSLDCQIGMTIGGWIKRSRAGIREIWLGRGNGISNATTPYWLEFQVSNRLSYFIGHADNTRHQLFATETISDTNWHSVYGVWDGTIMRLYLDGAQCTNTLVNSTPPSTQAFAFAVGKLGTYKYSYFQGLISDPIIAARGYSRDEISALADPSNVDLRVGGVPLILPPRRRFFASVEIPAPTFNPAWAQHVNTYIGLGR